MTACVDSDMEEMEQPATNAARAAAEMGVTDGRRCGVALWLGAVIRGTPRMRASVGTSCLTASR